MVIGTQFLANYVEAMYSAIDATSSTFLNTNLDAFKVLKNMVRAFISKYWK
jgi:hypothetical protein